MAVDKKNTAVLPLNIEISLTIKDGVMDFDTIIPAGEEVPSMGDVAFVMSLFLMDMGRRMAGVAE